MKMKWQLASLLAMMATAVYGADPGGVPGFVKAVFTGQDFDTTSDIFSNADSRVFIPEEMYADQLAEKTTVGFGGYMYMQAGETYEFKGYYDDYVSVKIGSTWVISKGYGCREQTGSFTPSATDWYKVELRVGNNSGAGGCTSISGYGILWKPASETSWRQFVADSRLFKTGADYAKLELCKGNFAAVSIVSSQVRENDPTVLDVVYRVTSDKPTVNVRALAFEDGERSFFKVVRPETFIDGTAANIGDKIAANTDHKLSWKVSSDWATDLAKCKFEVLVSDQGTLPLDWVTIPTVNDYPQYSYTYNTQNEANIMNAMFWYYADAQADLTIEDGYLKTTDGLALVNRDKVGEVINCICYVGNKMGLESFGGILFHYGWNARRKNIDNPWYSLCPKGLMTTNVSVYVGEKAYCVIDILGGASATTYPVTYLDSMPLGGWGNEYKTTKILLRRLEPGDVKLGNTKPVTLTKPFYMGVFEITQKQYRLVTGRDPSQIKGDMRPVESVPWDTIRGDSGTYNWPTVTTVDPNTFIGKLQAKTGLNFDLPTEAQWEYACRAGTTSDYNNGGSTESDLKVLGRCGSNRLDGKGGYSEHTTVGSYFPNAWGLYDMHGNVVEWCLDWYGDLNSDHENDWGGALSSSGNRVRRGGGWEGGQYSRGYGSSNRNSIFPTYKDKSYYGFRLCRTLTE